MFSKSNNNNDRSDETETLVEPTLSAASEAAPVADPTTRSVSYIGPTVHFKGEISAEESLVIEGSFEGKINQKDRNLTVGKKGQVNAEIHAKTIEVRGRVDGDLYATEVIRLFATSTVNGNIFCKRIVMDDGAVFNGTFDMSLNGKKAANGKLVIADDSANDSETIAQVAV